MEKENIVLNSQIVDYDLFPLATPENIQSQVEGSANKKLLLLLNQSDQQPELIAFLTKILGAVKYDLSQDAGLLVVTPATQLSLVAYCRHASMEQVIIFGLSPKDLMLNINVVKNQPLSMSGVQFLFTDPLAEMQNNAALKKPFWGAMQGMFA